MIYFLKYVIIWQISNLNDMPEFLERKLKKQYGANSNIPYKIMNKMGVMRGSKITAKGKAMESKHKKKMRVEREKQYQEHQRKK